MRDLSIEFASTKFKNPVLVGSGEPTMNVENIRRCVKAGAGGVVAKSVSNSPDMRVMFSSWRVLNERHQVAQGKVPRLFTLYARGAAGQYALEDWLPILREGRKIADAEGAVLIGSSMGPDIPSFTEHAKRMEDIGIKMVELNFGCPHPATMKGQHKEGIQIGQDAQFASEVIKAVTNAVSIPIVAKLTPQVSDLAEMAKLMKANGAAGITVSNRYVGFAVDIETAKPQLSGWAGVGGPWMKPLTLRWISKLHYEMETLPISGSNGVYDWRDVVEFLMSGATTVQICSVLLVKGFDYIEDVVTGLDQFLAEKGYGSAKKIIGIAARSALLHDEILKLGRYRSTIDEQKCIACGKCVTSCMFGAIESQDDRFLVNDKCAGCELCFSICPSDAIRFVPLTYA